MEKIIRRILREITETEYLYWKLPKKLINELGIELYNESDVAYLNEIHFDTREILIELYTHINGELEWYDGITNVPSTFKGIYSFPLDELPKSVKDFIGRRLDPKYMKYIITEDQNKTISDKLKSMVKKYGWEKTSKSVGGPKNLMKLLKINDPMDFLNLFNDLDVVQSQERPNLTLFRYVNGNNMVIYNKENGETYVNYYDIWSFLENNFGLNRGEIQGLIKDWLGEVYNLRVNTPKDLVGINNRNVG
jgi:hypothetical protein